MANRYNRPTMSRARQRAAQKKRLLIGGGALAALVVVALVILILPKGGKDRTATPASGTMPGVAINTGLGSAPAIEAPEAAEPEEAEEAEAEPEEEEAVEAYVADVEPEPEPASTPVPASGMTAEEAARRAQTRPSPAAEGFLPVFTHAETDEKIVAITVDDCYQADNLKQIVDKAIEVGGKLTIFPIGENVLKSKQSEVLKYAWEQGFELENHTFTHNGLFYVSDEVLAEEIYKQQLALCQILGVEYQCHFLRPKGGDARHDQRIQKYAEQLGYYGIAHWSASGTAGKNAIAKALKPGAIYLFHTTDKDREKLLLFIPWVIEQGYRLVTLNEMFGYPQNETRELTTPIAEHTIPPLEPYEMVYVPLKKTAYCWEAYLLQQKLIELGYMEGEPDGVYGDGSVNAIKAYQKDHGMKETGEASAELVREIIEGTAA